MLLFFLLAKATTANAPIKTNEEPLVYDTFTIDQNSIESTLPSWTPSPTPIPSGHPSNNGLLHGRHSTRAEKQTSEDKLQAYLEEKGSPLASYSGLLLTLPHWSTIIGICTIEQYGCTKAPYFNYWGIGGKSGLQRFNSLIESIDAISKLLNTYESKGYDTIEELNCYYVQPCSTNWLNTVLKTKSYLESL